MATVRNVDKQALTLLKDNRSRLTPQQYRTLRGQVLAGDAEGAKLGLRKILLLAASNAIKH